MKKYLARLSLRVKVTLSFCLVLAILLGGMSGILYSYYKNTFVNIMSESLSATMSTNANELKNLINSIDMAVDIVNNNEKAYCSSYTEASKIHLSTIGALIVSFQGRTDRSDLRTMLNEQKYAVIMMENIFNPLLDATHNRGSVSLFVDQRFPIEKYCTTWRGFSGIRMNKSGGVEKMDWYQKAIESGGEAYWFGDESVPEQLCMSRLLTYQYFTDYGDYRIEKLGVIAVTFDMTRIEERMDTGNMMRGAQIFIADRAGSVFYRSGEETLSDSAVAFLLKQAENGKADFRDCDGSQFLVQENDLAQGLVVLMAIPVDEVWHATDRMVNVIFSVMAAIFVFGIVIASLLSKQMVAPIVALALQMKRGVVERIDDRRLSQDEIGLLYRGYNEQQDKMQALIQQAWSSAEKQKEAELQLLQRQINPHFVYNTLGTMSAYALLQGQDDMAQNLARLSEIMRYCTKNPDGLVTLGEEMDFIVQYEAIQQMGFDDSVEFRNDVAPECLGILIPKLLIQPLVENAIIHGMDMTHGRGEITVTVQRHKDGKVIILVSDNGRADNIDAINRYISGEESINQSDDSLGLRNVYQRIERVFGNDGTLTYRLNEDGYTEAVITLSTYARDAMYSTEPST